MELSVQRLGVLLEVVESGSFSAAAKKLYMSQPSVSNHVRSLEASLGVNLINRATSGATPTPAGEVVVGYARQIFQLLGKIEEDVAGVENLLSGKIVVAGTTTIGTYLLPQIVARFGRIAPGVRTELRVGNEEAVVAWLLKEEVGLAVCGGEPQAEQLSVTPVFGDPFVLVTTADSEFAGRSVSPQELIHQRFLMREVGSATRHLQEEILSSWELRGVEQWDIWGPNTLTESVRAGLGVALMSRHAVATELQAGVLECIDVSPAPPVRQVSLVRKSSRAETSAERAFADLIRTLGTWPEPEVELRNPVQPEAPLLSAPAPPDPRSDASA
ncbi:LysR family transcriptional regulator [Arthrobacter tecti]